MPYGKLGDGMPDREILKPLVERTVELANDPCQKEKMELWARHQALQPTEKIPVCVTYENIPDEQWDFMFGKNHIRCLSRLGRYIEINLKKRLWCAEHVKDDHIIWPIITVLAVERIINDWGIPLEWRTPDYELGAKAIIPPFSEKIDLSKLTKYQSNIDEKATQDLIDKAQELVKGRLSVYPEFPDLGYQPFEIAVRMRGMESILLDVYDNPDKVEDLMEFITLTLDGHHKRREANGWINCISDKSGKYKMANCWRVNSSFLAEDFDKRNPQLKDEWAYVSAQSAAGLGPEMYARFVHPYNSRLASLFTEGTVYYHGCECLDQKLDIIATLPNLRRYHVSHWSSVEKTAKKLGGKVVLEVHAHPGRVIFGMSKTQMREELKRLVKQADGCPLDLNLGDVYSLNRRPDILGTWTAVAQEIAQK